MSENTERKIRTLETDVDPKNLLRISTMLEEMVGYLVRALLMGLFCVVFVIPAETFNEAPPLIRGIIYIIFGVAGIMYAVIFVYGWLTVKQYFARMHQEHKRLMAAENQRISKGLVNIGYMT